MSEMLERLVERAEQLIERIEAILPQPLGAPDWGTSVAFRYRKRSNGHGSLEPVRRVAQMRLADLREVDDQKEKIRRNTFQFVQGKPANNVLLTGARGTGKSSLVKACLTEFAGQGLRLIEVDKADLIDLPDIVDVVSERCCIVNRIDGSGLRSTVPAGSPCWPKDRSVCCCLDV